MRLSDDRGDNIAILGLLAALPESEILNDLLPGFIDFVEELDPAVLHGMQAELVCFRDSVVLKLSQLVGRNALKLFVDGIGEEFRLGRHTEREGLRARLVERFRTLEHSVDPNEVEDWYAGQRDPCCGALNPRSALSFSC